MEWILLVNDTLNASFFVYVKICSSNIGLYSPMQINSYQPSIFFFLGVILLYILNPVAKTIGLQLTLFSLAVNLSNMFSIMVPKMSETKVEVDSHILTKNKRCSI